VAVAPVVPRTERGSALVEFACVLPLLALLAFGIIEFGMAWQSKLTVQTGARAGARVGSTEGKLSTADQQLLLGAGSVLDDLGWSNVDWVVVFKSTTVDGAVPAPCLTPSPHSVSGVCNAYSGAQLQQVVAGTSPPSWFGCAAGALDLSWCPASRQSIQALGGDYLGVWVKAHQPLTTGIFGTTLTLTDAAVMRLEPQEA
jgi:hypothetical protein